MNNRFQILTIYTLIYFLPCLSFAQTEESTPVAKVTEKVISKSVPITIPSEPDSITPTPTVEIKGVQQNLNSIELLKTRLEMELSSLNTKLSKEELDYRVGRILKVKKEETESDLLFIAKLDNIKQTIAYETLDNSQDYIKTVERFLDTLYNEDTEVSENFKTTSKERYDNYIAKEKVVKVKLYDLIVTELPPKNGEPYFQYSGFAIIGNYPKQIRVEFYSDGFVARTDPKWIYKAAVEDNIKREVTIEGVIQEYHYGRQESKTNEDEKPISKIILKEWLLENKDELIKDIKSN